MKDPVNGAWTCEGCGQRVTRVREVTVPVSATSNATEAVTLCCPCTERAVSVLFTMTPAHVGLAWLKAIRGGGLAALPLP